MTTSMTPEQAADLADQAAPLDALLVDAALGPVLLDFHVMGHMADIEALHTCEGTETIQTLIVGRDITGVGAFA